MTARIETKLITDALSRADSTEAMNPINLSRTSRFGEGYTAAQARDLADDMGMVSVMLIVSLESLLSAARSDSEDDENDLLHSLAFTEGVPDNPHHEVIGALLGDVIITYSTSVEGFPGE